MSKSTLKILNKSLLVECCENDIISNDYSVRLYNFPIFTTTKNVIQVININNWTPIVNINIINPSGKNWTLFVTQTIPRSFVSHPTDSFDFPTHPNDVQDLMAFITKDLKNMDLVDSLEFVNDANRRYPNGQYITYEDALRVHKEKTYMWGEWYTCRHVYHKCNWFI